MRVPDINGVYHELSPEAVARIEEGYRLYPDEAFERDVEEGLADPSKLIPIESVLAELTEMSRRPPGGV